MIDPDPDRPLIYDADLVLRLVAENRTDGSIDFHGQTLELPQPRTFGDLDEVQTFVNEVHGSSSVTSLWSPPGPPPKVAPRSWDVYSHYNRRYNVIAVPMIGWTKDSWSVHEFTVLHQMAHFFNRESDEAKHGLGFVKCYLDLLEHVLHPTWALLMISALDEIGVPLA